MKRINLVNTPYYTIVDDDMFEQLNKFQWYLHESGYVWRYHGDSYTFMHHDILGFPADGQHTDHVNRNKLDNYRANLRFVTRSVSMQNRNTWNKWKLRGVSQLRNGGRWQAKIQYNGQRIQLGTFNTKEDAARAYDAMALQLFGPTAAINYPPETHL